MRDRCPRFGAPEQIGTVESSAIDEASGIVASRRRPGVFWVHNDSGDSARLFALSSKGRSLATYEVLGAEARDWEDLDIGMGPIRHLDYLYVGDIGDNQRRFDTVVVYRVPEPEVDPNVEVKAGVTAVAEAFRLRYPDGPHDAEALLVDPRTGALLIATKEREGPTQVFQADVRQPGPKPVGLRRIAELSLPASPLPGGRLVTAGTLSRDGRWVLLKTYVSAYLWDRGDGTLADAFQREPCRVPVALEPQGEAAAFVGDRLDYVTLSEGKRQPLYVFSELAADDSTDH